MCGSTRSTTSPSSSSTRRSTPCAAGCCGPKLMLNWRISVSGIWHRGGVVRLFAIHSIPATRASLAFSLTRATKRDQRMIMRSWRPSPIKSMPSCARSLNDTRRPLTPVHSASTVTVCPGTVAAKCDTSMCTPRLPSPSSRCGASTLRQVHSIRPTMKPVANTVGISRNSAASGKRCGTVFSAGMRKANCAVAPGCSVSFMAPPHQLPDADRPWRCDRGIRCRS